VVEPLESAAKRPKKKALTSQRGQGGGASVQVEKPVWEAWRSHLQRQPVQHWTAEELAQVFMEMGGVRYSSSHWCHLLREREGMYFYKPRPRDYRRSEDAPEQLADRIEATFDALQAMGFDLQRVKWGFADETAAQLHSNNARFWAFEPGLSRIVNTDRGSQSFFGFYGINATSWLTALRNGTSESIKAALLATKAAQSDCDALVVFWDNASSHKALETWGWERRIFFVWIPPYSPDLNPIEKLWKSTKRWTNEHEFVKQLEELMKHFVAGFDQVKDQLSFATSWWEKYKNLLSWYSPIFHSETSS
jgi:transposase